MSHKVTFDLEVFVVYTGIFVLIFVAVIYLCWLIGCNRNKDLTEFQVSAKNPAHVLTIRTGSDHAKKLMDHLLDRVLIQIDPSQEPAAEPRGDPGADPREKPLEEPIEEPVNLNVVTIASIHCSAGTSGLSPHPEEQQNQEPQMCRKLMNYFK